jgi:hypothetical protein
MSRPHSRRGIPAHAAGKPGKQGRGTPKGPAGLEARPEGGPRERAGRDAAAAREAGGPDEGRRRPTIAGVVAVDARVERRAALAWRRGR